MQSCKALSIGRGSLSVVGLLLSLLVIARPAAGQDLPIPQLSLWEAHMTSYGQTLCTALATPSISLLDSVYYDAQRVFLQIGDYTGNASWTTCAQRGAAVYRDLYVLPNNGQIPGYWNFTTGLRLDAQRTGNTASKNAAILLSQNAAFASDVPLDWTASADYSREVAYAILSYINAEALGQAPRQRRIDLVNQAYDHMNQWFVYFSWPGPWQQSPQTTTRLAPFMVGLTAHTLIRDWEQTGDARLIPALKLAADWMWANAWIPAAASFWYDSNSISGGGAPDLNLLIAPMYAFLYRQTGNTKYRDEGDQVFAGGVVAAYLGGGKQFDQNYWWSFDYVKWRTAIVNSDVTPPAISGVVASAISASGATITWTTNELSDSQVEYGLTTAYGSSTPLDPSRVTAHGQVLSGLAASTTYHYRVKSRDAAGNLAVSGDFTFATLATSDPSVGMVGYWKFDEGSGTIAGDSSGFGNTAGLINGPTWTTGMFGSALAFNGLNNYVNVPSTALLNAYPLTVAVWMKTSSTSGVSGIVNKYVAYSSNGWNLFINNGTLCAWYYANSSNAVYPGGGCPFAVPGSNDNQWHHVAFVVDATGGTLYVDGVVRGNIPWTGTPGAPTTTQPVHIGDYPGAFGGVEYFAGLLDDVRVYNRALSGTEIVALSNPTGTSASMSVAITAPTSGTTVAGTIAIAASATDTVGVAGVQFKLDDANLGAEVTAPPYSVPWNTTAAVNGAHTLKAVLRDTVGNVGTSAGVGVTVANSVDVTAPVISALTASSSTSSSAKISWTTNEASDTQVEYGLTAAYGSVTALDTTLVTSHSQTLSGLALNTWYHYRVKSRDAAGNLTVSGDFTFKTRRK